MLTARTFFLHLFYKIMIQRIQTIYLLLVSLLGVALCFLPIAELVNIQQQSYLATIWGIEDATSLQVIYTFIPYSFIILLIPLLSFSSIFLYKKRILQMRINVIAIVLMLFLYGVIYAYIQLGTAIIGDSATVTYKITTVIPIINAILTYLAIRGIGKDEALVRSLSRIR